MSKFKRKSVAAAGAIGVLAATLVGVAANPATAATTDIKVGTVAINAAGVIPLAQDSGIFAKNGLNVTEVVLFPAPPPSLAGLAAGAVQFVYAPSIPIVNAYANAGMALKVVAPADGYKPTEVAKAKKNAALAAKLDDTGVCVNPNSGIKSWKDLVGKTVSVPARSAQGEVTIAQAVKNAKGDPKSINWVTVPFPQAIPGVVNGTTQAAFTVEPFTSACIAAGMTNLGSPGIQFFDLENAVGMWVTTAAYAAANPAVVLAFQKSISQVNKVASTKAGWDQVLQKSLQYTGVDLATARAANPSYFPYTILAADLKRPADKMLLLGYLTTPLNTSGLLMRQYRP